MIRTGMCSVTLRALPVSEVVSVAAAAGLDCIEWGADVHVPPGDLDAADLAREVSREHALAIASYGSYFRAGWDAPATFGSIVQSAIRLGAPRIRICAGRAGSREATPEQWRAVTDATRQAGDCAADSGVELAFEFHAGTLTDDPDATVRLLKEIDRPMVRTYWQPPVGVEVAAALEGLRRVVAWVSAAHVFSWWPQQERQPLSARADLWRSALALLDSAGCNFDALLEFVPGDAPALVSREAHSLAELIGESAA